MHRIVWTRFLSLCFALTLLGLLFTASIGGVQAQAIPSQVISSQTHSSASELAKKPTKTPTATKTRKPKKTKMPTSTATVAATFTPSATTTSTATFTATFTPTPEADVQASTLPAGVYHLSGTLTRVTKNVLTWRTRAAHSTFRSRRRVISNSAVSPSRRGNCNKDNGSTVWCA